MKSAVEEANVPHCLQEGCNGLVKPDIVFFGEALPPLFHQNRTLPEEADLCIVMGTSLSVQPFASLPELVSDDCPRVLINQERVGSMGSRPDDVLLLGDCDDAIRSIAKACGWLEELEQLWASTAANVPQEKSPETAESEENSLEDEVDKLTREIDKTLQVSRDHEVDTLAVIARQEAKTKEPDSYKQDSPKEKPLL